MLAKRFVVCLLLLVGTGALADESSKQAKLRELMELQGTVRSIEEQLVALQQESQQTTAQILAQFKQQTPDFDQEMLAEVAAAADVFVEASLPSRSATEAADAWAKYYGEHVTEADLDQILKYHRSPAGRKDAAATQAATTNWSVFFMARSEQELEAAMSAYIEQLKGIAQRAREKKSRGQ